MNHWQLPTRSCREDSADRRAREVRFRETRNLLRTLAFLALPVWALLPRMAPLGTPEAFPVQASLGWLGWAPPDSPPELLLLGLSGILAAWLLAFVEWAALTAFYPQRRPRVDFWCGPLALMGLMLLVWPSYGLQRSLVQGHLSTPWYLLASAMVAGGTMLVAWRIASREAGLARSLVTIALAGVVLQLLDLPACEGPAALGLLGVTAGHLAVLSRLPQTSPSLRRVQRLHRSTAVGLTALCLLIHGVLVLLPR